jgi:deoxyhypusine synthase
MTYDELMAMSEEDRRNAFESEVSRIGDLEAERDSFKNENETLLSSNKKLEEELKKTKELNFTLGRKVNTAGQKSAEELLNELFK